MEQIRERSFDFCEGELFLGYDCEAENGKPHPVTGSLVVLTVAHLNHRPEDSQSSNLAHLCQRCHNTYDAPHRQRTREARKRRQMVHEQGQLFEAESTEARYRCKCSSAATVCARPGVWCSHKTVQRLPCRAARVAAAQGTPTSS